jgi:hypothetical protein
MNSVNIIGFLRENIDDTFRNFEYELPYLEENEKARTVIVVRNWTNQPNSRLNLYPANSRVAIHGHLDGHEKFGTILVVEQLQVIGK